MDHRKTPLWDDFYGIKTPPKRRRLIWRVLLAFVLALLVGNAAAGLASGLAGGLALAATAILCTVTQITRLDGLDMFHSSKPP
jgi:hypothetical protein